MSDDQESLDAFSPTNRTGDKTTPELDPIADTDPNDTPTDSDREASSEQELPPVTSPDADSLDEIAWFTTDDEPTREVVINGYQSDPRNRWSCPWCLYPPEQFREHDDGRLGCISCSAVIPVDTDWYQAGEKIVL